MVMVSSVEPTQQLRRYRLKRPNCFGDSSLWNYQQTCNQRSRSLMRTALNKRTQMQRQLAYLPFLSRHCSQLCHKSQELVMVMVSSVEPTQQLRRYRLKRPNCFGDSSLWNCQQMCNQRSRPLMRTALNKRTHLQR